MDLCTNDGNPGCCEALQAIRGREGCSLNRIIKCFDIIILLIVLVLQGSIVNYYLIHKMEGSGNGWYFWFLADFIVLICIMTATFLARRHYSNIAQNPDGTPTTEPRGALGLFPLSYLSWLLYSSLLTAKVILLFHMDIAATLSEQDWYGPQFLKVVVGCSAIVFLLLVDTHHDAVACSSQLTFIQFLVTVTAFEILDCVTFMSLLFPSESGLILSYGLENTILALTCANFLLPTLGLYTLSQCDFGARPRLLGLQMIYRILHVCVINGPYFCIRMYLWGYFQKDVSVFVLKNAILVFAHLRSFFPEAREWFLQLGKIKKSLLNVDETTFDPVPGSATSRKDNNSASIELNPQSRSD